MKRYNDGVGKAQAAPARLSSPLAKEITSGPVLPVAAISPDVSDSHMDDNDSMADFDDAIMPM
jgi:hypothetical protein